MKSLEGNDLINQEVLMLPFGNNWAEQVGRSEQTGRAVISFREESAPASIPPASS
jgi:hypothetical protein